LAATDHRQRCQLSLYLTRAGSRRRLWFLATRRQPFEAMSKRKPKTAAPAGKRTHPAEALRQALAQRNKADLVDVLLELAQADRGILRQLSARFDVVSTPSELVAATQLAIADATDFDERDINRNFDYDYEAYGEVKRNFQRLAGAEQLRQAMQLSLELMKQASHQVEMSDEGMMTQDIEDCLSVVLQAARNCDLPAAEILDWCSAMTAADRVGFIAEQPIKALRNQFQASAAPAAASRRGRRG
jgi:hypothetical protein